MPQLAFALASILAQESESTGGSLLGYLPLIFIFGAVVYFFMYVPRRRQKKAAEMRESITIGDEIRTIGGIYGTVRSEDDESFTLDLGDGTKMRIDKRAVAGLAGDDAE